MNCSLSKGEEEKEVRFENDIRICFFRENFTLVSAVLDIDDRVQRPATTTPHGAALFAVITHAEMNERMVFSFFFPFLAVALLPYVYLFFNYYYVFLYIFLARENI